MKHLTYSDKSLLIGDEAADLLLEYAALLADRGRADSVTVWALSSDGDDVEATMLLDEGAPIMTESSTTQVAEPDNAEAISYIRDRMAVLAQSRPETQSQSHPVVPDSPENFVNMDVNY